MDRTLIRGGKNGRRMMKYYRKRVEEIEKYIRKRGGRATLLELEENFGAEILTVFFRFVKVRVMVGEELLIP